MSKIEPFKIESLSNALELPNMSSDNPAQQRNIDMLKLISEKIQRFNLISEKIQRFNGINSAKSSRLNRQKLVTLLEEIGSLKHQCDEELVLQNLDNRTEENFSVRAMLLELASFNGVAEAQKLLKAEILKAKSVPEPLSDLSGLTISKLSPDTQVICRQVELIDPATVGEAELITLKKARQALTNESLRADIGDKALIDIRRARTKLNQQINQIQSTNEPEKEKRSTQEAVIASSLGEGLSSLSADEHLQLTGQLKNIAAYKNALPTIEDEAQKQGLEEQITLLEAQVSEAFPFLTKDYELTLLSSGNNTNFKLVPKEGAADNLATVVLQLESIDIAMVEERSFANTAFESYMGNDYMRCLPVYDDAFIGINLKEFSNVGDLQHEVKGLDLDERVRVASERMMDLTKFCQQLQSENAVYTDIKATNFLVRDDGSIFTTDYKSIRMLGDDNVVNTRDLAATEEFKPPEARRTDAKDIDPEKFMSYQVGLSLYECLVCPECDDWAEEPDLTLPVFEVAPHGPIIKELIESTLEADPNNRASLHEIEGTLNVIKKIANEEDLKAFANFSKDINELNKISKKFSDQATELVKYLGNNSVSLDVYEAGFNQRSALLNDNLEELIQQQQKIISQYKALDSLPDSEENLVIKQSAKQSISIIFGHLYINDDPTLSPIEQLEKSVAKDKKVLNESRTTLAEKTLKTYMKPEEAAKMKEAVNDAQFKPRTIIKKITHFFKRQFSKSYSDKFSNMKAKLQRMRQDVNRQPEAPKPEEPRQEHSVGRSRPR